jgi:hypothetical protein
MRCCQPPRARRWWIGLWLAHCLAVGLTGTAAVQGEVAEAIRFSERTAVVLAAAEEGRELIAREDDFTRALSRFDLQSRLNTTRAVAVEDLLELYRGHVTDWPEADATAVRRAVEFVADRLREFDLRLPERVAIVRTTGKEEAGAAYCRGPAIILPQNMLRQNEEGLRRLVAHELFHVLSTHDAELRGELYRLIGFEPCPPIAPPESLRERTIANPDAPRIDCVIRLKLADGEEVTAAPILFAEPGEYDPAAGKSLFGYLRFRLMVVERDGDGWRAASVDDRPRMHDPRMLDDYWRQIGRNTNYILHPDEILADNFAHLVMESARLPTPALIDQIKERLRR